MMDVIIAQRSKGNKAIARAVETKLILKGIDPQNYTSTSPDDPAVIRTLEDMARQLGVNV